MMDKFHTYVKDGKMYRIYDSGIVKEIVDGKERSISVWELVTILDKKNG